MLSGVESGGGNLVATNFPSPARRRVGFGRRRAPWVNRISGYNRDQGGSPHALGTGGSGRETGMKKSESQDSKSASQMLDAKIKELGDWRGTTLEEVRGLIKEADPEVVEEWKWRKPSNPGTPVWSHNGGICTGETYKNVVKLTFFSGAALKDPSGLFNSSLEGKVRRAIDIHEGEKINKAALKALILEAVASNLNRKK